MDLISSGQIKDNGPGVNRRTLTAGMENIVIGSFWHTAVAYNIGTSAYGVLAMSVYLWPLVTLPAVITEPGAYITRGGERVTVVSATQRHSFDCNGFYGEDSAAIAESWHRSGRLYSNVECINDIVQRV
uniref:hypothetical protein n=1 Tax=Pseudomonas fluorescens TaxID=294 RepID=UPI001F489C2D|nr:hypothetical protein [Pseudomonas fluorescens]